MAQIYYQINAGYPNFTAHIEPNVAPDQTHSSTGIYSFDDIPTGNYSITITDAIGCEGFFNNIIVSDTTTTTTTVATIGGYGILYNWWVTQDLRKISSSDDWIVPSKVIFEDIETFCGGWTIAGDKLKEEGFTHWNSSNISATNDFGFSAVGSGFRATSGLFAHIRDNNNLWTSDEFGGDPTSSWSFALASGFSSSSISPFEKQGGLSIRLCNLNTSHSNGYIGTYTQNNGIIIPTIVINDIEWTAPIIETQYRNMEYIHGCEGGIYTPISSLDWAILTTEGLCYYDDNINNG